MSDDEGRIRGALARAKQRGSGRQRPGPLMNTPAFDAQAERASQLRPPPGIDQPPPMLSPETQQGLSALAQHQTEAAPALPAQEEPPAAPLSPDEQLRASIEARLQPMDLGQFLMNGVLTQSVPIISTGNAQLVVSFQTCPEAVEVYIDARLAEEQAVIRQVRRESGQDVQSALTNREYLRRQNEWALAAQVAVYQGNNWPELLTPGGGVSEDAMQLRLKYVRSMPSPVFVLVTKNLGWFIDRVGQALTGAALGNG